MDANEEFELKAKQFYAETDIWPPGKDMPLAMFEPDGYETRHKAFAFWCKLQAENKRLREALEDMCHQFAGWSEKNGGGYCPNGLSALEHAFGVLGWDNPQPAKEARCQIVGCKKQITCGTNTKTGYKNVCSEHYQALKQE